MKKTLITLSICIACGYIIACNGINYATLLTDAQFGVTAGCSQKWIPEKECTIITDGITTALAVISKDPNQAKPAVIAFLGDMKMLLDPNGNGYTTISWLQDFIK